jgi:23S rRNA (pseudouridine1915-N3)-methyltransferase
LTLYIVAVGRVKNSALRSACQEYCDRLRRYQRLEIREVRDAGLRDRDAESARKVEGKALLKAVPKTAVVVAVTRGGGAASSRDLAVQLQRWWDEGRDVAFVVGGPHGLDAEVLAAADSTLSLSSMTFAHEIARLVLLEQLYRAGTISRGESYHKGTD